MNAKPLTVWMKHRAKLLRLQWPADVAELSGVSPVLLYGLSRRGTIDGIGRSARPTPSHGR